MEKIVFFVHEHLILSFLWVLLLCLIIFLLFKEYCSKFKFINNIQAINLINKKNAIVIDTRSSRNYQKGHIVNSIHISLQKVLSGKIKNIIFYNSHPIILIFSSSYIQNKYIDEFLKCGFKKIFVLRNGIYGWDLENLPLVS
ncbi:MAG: rhodanese-like domain-containing protein [Buchnera aphidicola (Pentalonia nigronervosa)]|jgi:rhodanese-related sulfurtransferase|uniref:Rhodanese-like domain-containing protein n=1 Tax=Buchnera aphidicola (Pentalonia nigronervosa) TaxID=1309793 RepID=A0A7H1AZ96_9GAMM|nr:MAG: rhodanese-like domain-containing protein [Buchnera aphidicola (Pentalonia nigronervosa)]